MKRSNTDMALKKKKSDDAGMVTNEDRVGHAETNKKPNDGTSSLDHFFIATSKNEANSGLEPSRIESCIEEGTCQREEFVSETALTKKTNGNDKYATQNDSSQTQLDFNSQVNTNAEEVGETTIQQNNAKENGENNPANSETEVSLFSNETEIMGQINLSGKKQQPQELEHTDTNNTTTRSTQHDLTYFSNFDNSQSQQVDQREEGVMSEESNEEDENEESEEIGTSFMDDNKEEEVGENENVDGMSEENNEDNEEDESEEPAEMSEIDKEEDEEGEREYNEEVEESDVVAEKDNGVGEEDKSYEPKTMVIKDNEEKDDISKRNKPITYNVGKYIELKKEMDEFYNQFEEECLNYLNETVKFFLRSEIGSKLVVKCFSSKLYFKNAFVIMNVLHHIHKKFIEQDISEGSKLAQLLVLDRIQNNINTILYTQHKELGLLYTFLPYIMKMNHYVIVFSIDESFLESQCEKMKNNGLKTPILSINDFNSEKLELDPLARMIFIDLSQLNNNKTEQSFMPAVKRILTQLDKLNKIDLLIFDGIRDISEQNLSYPQQYFKFIKEIKKSPTTVFKRRLSKDIKDKTHIRNCDEIINNTNFNPLRRLVYEVKIVQKGSISKAIANKINMSPLKNKHGVIVCNEGKKCGELVKRIIDKGILASFYNPDLVNNENNDKIFKNWKNGQIKVLVVEKASPKMRREKQMAFVIHVDPCSLEQYVCDTAILGNAFSETKCILYYDATKSNKDLGDRHEIKMQQYVGSEECCLNKRLKKLFHFESPMSVCVNCGYCKKYEKLRKGGINLDKVSI
ncbi:hypothetical protein QTN25_008217 [Entamoeba marina]